MKRICSFALACVLCFTIVLATVPAASAVTVTGSKKLSDLPYTQSGNNVIYDGSAYNKLCYGTEQYVDGVTIGVDSAVKGAKRFDNRFLNDSTYLPDDGIYEMWYVGDMELDGKTVVLTVPVEYTASVTNPSGTPYFNVNIRCYDASGNKIGDTFSYQLDAPVNANVVSSLTNSVSAVIPSGTVYLNFYAVFYFYGQTGFVGDAYTCSTTWNGFKLTVDNYTAPSVEPDPVELIEVNTWDDSYDSYDGYAHTKYTSSSNFYILYGNSDSVSTDTQVTLNSSYTGCTATYVPTNEAWNLDSSLNTQAFGISNLWADGDQMVVNLPYNISGDSGIIVDLEAVCVSVDEKGFELNDAVTSSYSHLISSESVEVGSMNVGVPAGSHAVNVYLKASKRDSSDSFRFSANTITFDVMTPDDSGSTDPTEPGGSGSDSGVSSEQIDQIGNKIDIVKDTIEKVNHNVVNIPQYISEAATNIGSFISDQTTAIDTFIDEQTTAISEKVEEIGTNIETSIEDMAEDVQALPGQIMDGVTGLFVPDEQVIADTQDQWEELLRSRFGVLYDSVVMIDEFGNSFSADAQAEHSGYISFPLVTLNLAGVPFDFGGWDVKVVPDGFEFLFDTLKLIINVLATYMFVNAMRNKFERILGGM